MKLNGFEFPEDLYYLVDKHVWVRPIGEGLARVGLTPVVYKLLRHSLVAISVRPKTLGQEVPQGKSVAMVESLKYIGPLAAPFTGVVERANALAESNLEAFIADPYGDGWIVEMRPTDWAAARAALLTGDAAMQAYRTLLEAQNLQGDL